VSNIELALIVAAIFTACFFVIGSRR